MNKFSGLIFLFFLVSIASHAQLDVLQQEQLRQKRIFLKEKHMEYPEARIPGGNDQIMSQPEQDCNSAIPVCQNVYSQPVSYSGYGNTQEVPSSSCLGNQEKNSVWYIFTVTASGSLIFQINPVSSSDDYDFALYNITGTNCSGVTNGSAPEVNCNFSATAGSTGLQTGQTNTSQPASGTNQNAPVNVTVGQTYVLVVSNYSSSQSGYTLDFSGGTASIFDNVPPAPQSVFAPCGQTSLTLQMSEAVTCASIAPNASDFSLTGPGGPFTITSASGVNCGTSSSQINMNFSPALQLGQTYTLTINSGSDGNTLIDNCLNPAVAGSQVTFSVSNPPAVISGATSVCNGSSVTLTASNGTGWSWAPGGQTTQSISVSPTTNTTYTVTVTNGTCGTSNDTHTVTVNASPDANFTINPNPACVGQAVTFTNTSTLTQTCIPFVGCTNNPANMLWSYGDGPLSFDASIAVTNPSSDTHTHTYTTAGTYTVSLQASVIGGCSNTQTLSLVVNPSSGPIAASANVTTICPGQSAILTATGGASYTWSGPSSFTSTSNPVTVSPTVTSTYTVTSPGCSGTNTASVTINVSTGTISTGPVVGAASVCPNATAVTYSVANNAGSTYAWTVPAGASIVSGQGTNSITVNFGAGGGNIGVTETGTCGTGTASLAITVSSTPVTSSITGPATVCPNATGITYSVTNTSGSTYAWTVPAGATISGGQGTNSISVNFGASGGTVSVTESSACGTGSPVNIAVTVSSTPVTSAITGPSTICASATGQIFSVINTSGSTYTWTVPVGATIVSGQGTNSITVNFGSGGGNVGVTETSSCGAGSPVTLAVTTTSAPATPAISGPAAVCANASGQTFSVTNTPGDTYTWTVPAGATIVSGQNTNMITVDFGSTAGNITVMATNGCGSSAQATQAVSINPATVTSSITGSSPLCAGANAVTYLVTNTSGSSYTWTVPAGATIVSGQGTNSISVNFGTTGGNVSVTETGICGAGTAVNFPVVINQAPATPVITGNATVCTSTLGEIYSVPVTAGSTYAWTATGGITIASGAATNSVTADFGISGGTLQVTETNTCGNASATITVTVSSPAIAITASAPSVCLGFSSTLTASGATTYTWTPAGSLNTTGGATVVATPTATTTYTVVGTQAGCAGAATTTITLSPPLSITLTPTSNAVCNGTNTTIVASGASSYSWSPSVSLNTTSGATVIASPVVATTYTVNGTTASCAGSQTITIGVTPVPVINLTPTDVTICQGQSTQIDATGATTYAWAPNTNFTSLNSQNSSVVVNPSTSLTYTVIGTLNGCNNSAFVNVTVLPQLNPDAGVNDTICIGESVSLSGQGGGTYSWLPATGLVNPANAFTSASPLVTTTYTLTTSYNGQCPVSDNVTIVVNPLPIVNAGMDTTIDVEDAAILSGYSSTPNVLWTDFNNTLNCFTCLSPLASPYETSTYVLTATNEYGCVNTDTVTVFVSQEYALYVPIAFSPNGDFINEGWKPKGFGIKKIQIYIYDRWGMRIYEADDLDSFWDGTFKGKVVQNDVYVFKITAEAFSGNKISRVGHVTVVR